MREERRPRALENKVLRGIFGSKRGELTGNGQNYTMRSLMICTPHQIFFRMIKSRRMRWAGHVASRGRGEAHTRLWWGSLRERGHLEEPGVVEKIILRWIFRKGDVGVKTGSNWLRIGTGDGHL